MKINIGKASELLGVTRETLRRWEVDGKIYVERTPKGHRRYDATKLQNFRPKLSQRKKTIAYARVSSREQKADLARQVTVLESYCASHGWSHEIIQDLGSGLNYGKKVVKAK